MQLLPAEEQYRQRPIAVQPDSYPQEAQSLDFFHPFLDPEMLDFPNGKILDFSQFDTSSFGLNSFDRWVTRDEVSVGGDQLHVSTRNG
jgi:hypothetical protein